MLQALKAEVNNLKLEPPFSQFKRLVFSLSGRGGSFTSEVAMVEYFKVIKRKKEYVVRYKEGKVDVASFPNYLRAKFRAFMGNMIIAHAEMGVR